MPPRRPRRLAALVVPGLLLASLGACGGDDDDGGAAATTAPAGGTAATATSSPPGPRRTTTTAAAGTTTTAPAATTTTAAPCPPAAGGTESLDGPMPGDVMLLTDVTVATDDARCTDSLTFTFRSSVVEPPGYRVAYGDPPFAGPSGEAVEVAGDAFLVVRFEPAATADLAAEGAPATYTGPHRIRPRGAAHVREVRLVEAVEGVVIWVVGLAGRRPFSAIATGSTPALTLAVG